VFLCKFSTGSSLLWKNREIWGPDGYGKFSEKAKLGERVIIFGGGIVFSLLWFLCL